MNKLTAAAVLSVTALAAPVSSADLLTMSGSSGSKAASVQLNLSGDSLTVVLTNTSLADVMFPADVLTAVFFHIDGAPVSLTPVSAVLTAGSSVILDSQPVGGVVGGEWAYLGSLTESGILSGSNHGISSSGLGIFGGPSFPGDNLDGPAAVNGLQYGLTSAGDNPATGNGGIMGSGGLIKNSVTFTFSGATGLSLPQVRSAYFLYGTAVGEGGFAVPTPGVTALLGISATLASRRRR